ncbi:MAG: hypothetical protein QXT13_09675 [Pyrobaculum sp.]
MAKVLQEISLGLYTIAVFVGAVSIAGVIMYPVFYLCCGLSILDIVIGAVSLALLALIGKNAAYTLGQYGARRRILEAMYFTFATFTIIAAGGIIYFNEPEIVIAIPAAHVANMLLKRFYLQGMGIKEQQFNQLLRWWEIP